MSSIWFSEKAARQYLYPIGQVQPVADLRIGITTIREKWERVDQSVLSVFSSDKSSIPANLLPYPEVLDALTSNQLDKVSEQWEIRHAWKLNQVNGRVIRSDFQAILDSCTSQPVPPEAICRNHKDIFIEPGASIHGCWLNAEEGPIYIGKNVLIMEGVSIRGPVAICEGAVVKMGTRIYGATTIGRFCTVGGEIKNVLMQDFSNKAHDGYLGDSVIGHWCNLGAGTSNSNLKNTAGEIEVWDQAGNSFSIAGKKAGLYMGDYSTSAINTAFNTGTTVGVSCNVFGPGLTPRFIPDFSWGYLPFNKFEFNKAIDTISNWKRLKNKTIEEQEIQTLKHIFDQSLKTI
jgi:UDP-N-acetylglucosamine diphosphorylase / glucose-1-phosphate thymidylyltransferase / UDP-N-acetylgalactosamine diphosphorylase / glucosamine-1-phosphate N-acetyltransferase / galactosamine-1-phosphate N-acetyltransferase